MICSKCGKKIPEEAVFCGYCGEKVPEKVCVVCGAKMEKDWLFCPVCGLKWSNEVYRLTVQHSGSKTVGLLKKHLPAKEMKFFCIALRICYFILAMVLVLFFFGGYYRTQLLSWSWECSIAYTVRSSEMPSFWCSTVSVLVGILQQIHCICKVRKGGKVTDQDVFASVAVMLVSLAFIIIFFWAERNGIRLRF